jgi:hypothetical protein
MLVDMFIVFLVLVCDMPPMVLVLVLLWPRGTIAFLFVVALVFPCGLLLWGMIHRVFENLFIFNQHLHHANSHEKLSASHTRVTKYLLANPLGSKTRSFSSPYVKVWRRGWRTCARWKLTFCPWSDQDKMVLHTTLDGSWKPLYTCILSFPFLLVLTSILVAFFALVSCLCINHGWLATLFVIALWPCIPIFLFFVWCCGRWYLWTSCHDLSLFLCGYVMLFIHIFFV